MKSFKVKVNGVSGTVIAHSSVDAVLAHAENIGVDIILSSSVSLS